MLTIWVNVQEWTVRIQNSDLGIERFIERLSVL